MSLACLNISISHYPNFYTCCVKFEDFTKEKKSLRPVYGMVSNSK